MQDSSRLCEQTGPGEACVEKTGPVWACVGLVDWKRHRKFNDELTPFQMTTLLRVWTGSAMTADHWATLHHREATCSCGCARQTVWHLLWECPDLDHVRPPQIRSLSEEPAWRSAALLCPKGLDAGGLRVWKQACMWAIQALKDSKPADKKKMRLTTRDSKGHVLAIDQSGLLAYRTKCIVSHASHQSYHVCAHPCKKADHNSWVEGEERSHFWT